MPPHRQDGDDPKLDPCYESLIPLAEVTLLQRDDAAVGASSEWVAGPPRAVPLPTAVEAGVFGGDTNGPFMPDAEEVEALTGEHANEMIVLLSDWQAVEHAQRFGYDPATRRVPTTQEQRDFLSARLDTEHKRLAAAYTDAVAAYAEGFGDAAASSLDEWVRKTVADGEPQWEPYPPSHPWHYYHAGDNASPMPVGQIEPDPQAGQWLEQRLPKNPAKRMQVLREMLEKEQASLAADQERYKEIVERGAEALSRFDREIAHTSDAMAVATALALKYTHISQGKGRVKWLSAGT
jgi:hypothetical protein